MLAERVSPGARPAQEKIREALLHLVRVGGRGLLAKSSRVPRP